MDTKLKDVGKALNLPLVFLAEAERAIVEAGDGQNISANDFDIGEQVKALGIGIGDLVGIVNNGVRLGLESNFSVVMPDDADIFGTPALQVAYNAALQGSASLISVVLDVRHGIFGDPHSPLKDCFLLFQ